MKLLKFGNAVIENDYDRESFFKALADMFYFNDGEPDNDKK